MSIQPIFNNMASGNTRVIFVPRLATGADVRSQINAMWGIDIRIYPFNPVLGTERAGEPFQKFLDLLIKDPNGDVFNDQTPKLLYASDGTPTEIMIWFNIQIDGLFLIKKNDGARFFCDYQTAISEYFFDRTNDDLVLPVTGTFRSMLRSTPIHKAANALKEETNRYKQLNRDLNVQLAAATEQKAKADKAYENATEDAEQALDRELLGEYFSKVDADAALKRQFAELKEREEFLKRQFAELKEREELAELSELERERYNTLSGNANMYSRFVQAHKKNLAAKEQEVKTLQETLAATQRENGNLLSQLHNYESASELPGAGKAGDKSTRRDDDPRPSFSDKRARGGP